MESTFYGSTRSKKSGTDIQGSFLVCSTRTVLIFLNVSFQPKMTENGGKEDFLGIEEMNSVRNDLVKSGIVGETPLLKHMQYLFPQVAEQGIDLYLKLESMQITGSFEIRAVVNQMAKIKSRGGNQNRRTKFVTISDGNYGKAFGYVLQQRSLLGVCIMPDSSSNSDIERIKSYGTKVELCPESELQSRMDKYVTEDEYHYCNPNDDRDFIAGVSSIGLEILEALPEFDILLICCKGGGLPAGVACAIRSKLKQTCQIYAVEHEGFTTMFELFKNKMAASIPTSTESTVTSSHTGTRADRYCRVFVDDVILVTDEEILSAAKKLYDAGLVVEGFGSAAMAALLSNKVPDVKFKKVVVIVSGGNITRGGIKIDIP